MKKTITSIGVGLLVLVGTGLICYNIGKTRTEDKYRPEVKDLLRRITWLENGIAKRP